MFRGSLVDRYTKRYQFKGLSLKLNAIHAGSPSDAFFMSQIDNIGVCTSPVLYPSLNVLTLYDDEGCQKEYRIQQFYECHPDVQKHLNWLFKAHQEGKLAHLIRTPEIVELSSKKPGKNRI